MGLLRLVAVGLFGAAALGSFGWGYTCSTATGLGLVAAGLLFAVASSGTIPQPPSST